MRVVVSALLVASILTGGDRSVVSAQPDGVLRLLRRLEQVVKRGGPAAIEPVLTPGADRARVRSFAETEFPPQLTDVIIQERDRNSLPGTLPGNGYRLVVDAFEQSSVRARVGTWQLDIKRTGEPGADDEWSLDDATRISAVENLHKLSLNPRKAFTARALKITTDDLDLELPDGRAFVAETDQGVTAVVLLGRGEMSFHPPSEIERGQVRIFAGSERLQTSFDAMFLRISQDDFDQLVTGGALASGSVDARDFRRADEIFRDDAGKSYSIDLGDLTREPWSVLPPPSDFLAEIHTRRYDVLTYTRSGGEPEDISLFDRKRHRTVSLYASPRKKAELGRRFSEDRQSDLDVEHYDIDLTVVPERLWLEGRAKLTFRVNAPSISSVTLRLASPLTVQSITSDEFGRLFGLRVKNQNGLVINLASTVLRDTELHLTITYSGRLEPQTPDREMLEQLPDFSVAAEPSFLYSSGSPWYPQPGTTDFATATLKITVPAGMDCVASGDPASDAPILVPAKDAQGARKQYVFAATQPLRYLSFIVSRLTRAEALSIRVPDREADSPSAGEGVWYRSLDIAIDANPRQVGRARDLIQRTADIAQFYTAILDDIPYPSYTVALVENDLPGGHSPGYFSALNQPLPTSTLVWRNDPAAFNGYPDFFLAHELAHQWWGQAVGYRNYHEQWISEGLSQYFAALYAERERGPELFASVMRQMRKSAMDYADEGPIALGYRLGHIRGDSRVFRAVLYNKTAVVLHMLRRLVGDEPFFRGLRRFYVASRFQKTGTDEFRAAMEAESGRSLDRFFEEWIEGSTYPKVRFGYRVEGAEVVLHAQQVGDRVFVLPLTVTLQYGDRRSRDVSLVLTERDAELRVALAGPLRSAEVSRDDGTLVEVIKN